MQSVNILQSTDNKEAGKSNCGKVQSFSRKRGPQKILRAFLRFTKPACMPDFLGGGTDEKGAHTHARAAFDRFDLVFVFVAYADWHPAFHGIPYF
ncbi:MAG: hypothetical protein HFG08_10060 [Oscillibacter sp.]|nr:hypothetical protein [Oscillibacter sp.]